MVNHGKFVNEMDNYWECLNFLFTTFLFTIQLLSVWLTMHYLRFNMSTKNYFTESLIELNITGTLPDEVDEISTVRELNAIKLKF